MTNWTARPWQLATVDKFLATDKPHRLIVPHPMGSGKTGTALLTIQRSGAKRVLIVCPAIVRSHWGREIERVLPGREYGLIQYGRTRLEGLTKAQRAQRDAAYAAPIQVVSYDLFKQTDETGWDLIIIDEAHNLRNPTSKQSKDMLRRFDANPEVMALATTATLIPNEAVDLWNPVDTLFPRHLGARGKAGQVSWKFKEKYCHSEVIDWGRGPVTKHYGFKREREAELRALLAPITHEVSEAEVAPYMPPLHVEPLICDDPETNPGDEAIKWALDVEHQASHFGIYTHLRETARRVADSMRAVFPKIPVFVITGDDTTEVRDRLLEQARHAPRSIVVGTTHALAVGISLSFQKAALVLEFQTALDEVKQFLGRFARQDGTKMPTYVKVFMTADDITRAALLKERVDDNLTLFKETRVDGLMREAFADRELSSETLQAMAMKMFSNVNTDRAEWEETNE